MSSNSSNPFLELSEEFKSEPIERFDPDSPKARAYLAEVTASDEVLSPLFIGWVCEPNTFFAYLHMGMKKQAREAKSTHMAAEMARAGFQVLLPQVNAWVKSRKTPVILVPVASRYGVSERFASELKDMLDPKNTPKVTIETLFEKLDKSVEVKSIYSWPERNLAVKTLFKLTKKPDITNFSVLLVDDFVSSGSSLREAAQVLKTLGAKEVAGIALSTNQFLFKKAD